MRRAAPTGRPVFRGNSSSFQATQPLIDRARLALLSAWNARTPPLAFLRVSWARPSSWQAPWRVHRPTLPCGYHWQPTCWRGVELWCSFPRFLWCTRAWRSSWKLCSSKCSTSFSWNSANSCLDAKWSKNANASACNKLYLRIPLLAVSFLIASFSPWCKNWFKGASNRIRLHSSWT